METNLTPEQSQALSATGEVPLTVVDPITNRRYVLVSADDYAKLDTIKAIGTGIAQMENQEGQDLTEAISDIRHQMKQRE